MISDGLEKHYVLKWFPGYFWENYEKNPSGMKSRKELTIHYFVHHRKGRSPGQRFRCEQYVPYLVLAGFSVRWNNLLNEQEDHLFYASGRWAAKAWLVIRKFFQRRKEVQSVKPGDIAFVYREAFMLGTTYFERALKKRGAKLVFDFDDAIWLPEVSAGNRKLSFLKRPGKAADIGRLSDLVIVGNEYLAEYARQFATNVVVIPTTIDTDYHKLGPVTKSKAGICIGWTGSESTVKHFETIVPVLKALQIKYGDQVYFKLITNRLVHFPQLELEATLWNRQDEVEQLAEIDIGIMPLPEDEWSKGKCGFKLLQYMAMGKAAVGSPVGVNTEIIEDGENGFLASTEQEWIAQLSRLIDNPDLRRTLGKAGRKTVEERFSVESQRDRYETLFKELAE